MPNSYQTDGLEKDIYVLLTDTGTAFTKLIKTFTAAPYNHASIALDKELKELFSFGRERPTKPWTAGFIEEDIYEGAYRLFPYTRCALLRLSVTKRQQEAVMNTIRGFQERRNIYRYNLLGLLGVLLKFELAPKNSYFCSQFVAEVLRNIEHSLWARSPALITPNCFLRHPAFELVYEGYLFGYPLLNRDKVADVKKAFPFPGYLHNIKQY